MPTASTPGAPLLARTFSYASNIRRLEISNGFTFGLGLVLGSSPGRAGLSLTLVWPAPSLRSHYKRPLPLLRAGPPMCPGSVLCPTGYRRLGPPSHRPGSSTGPPRPNRYRNDRFSCSMPAPTPNSRHATYTPDTTKPPPGSQHTTMIGCAFIPGTPDNPGLDAIVPSFDASAVVLHVRLLVAHLTR